MVTETVNNLETLRSLYTTMLTARHMDLIEQSYTSRGEAFFHVSGAGHEGSIALYPHLIDEDWLHCHYRDKALMLARGITPYMFFLSLFNKDESHSRGRQMNAHMSSPEHRILSIVGPVGNSALQAVGVAATVKSDPENPLVLCALGEGMTQESEVLEAIGHAVRAELPVLFVIQDNRFAISTRTPGQTFYSRPDGEADEFYGIPITRIDGRHTGESIDRFGEVVSRIRSDRKPQIVVFSVERLHNHTNADDQRVYRSPDEIEEASRSGDPIAILRARLLDDGVDEEELRNLEEKIRADLLDDARRAQLSPEPTPMVGAKAPLPPHLTDPAAEYIGSGEKNLVMLEAIRDVLDSRMAGDERITLFGEDIEDPKGDVFGITRGLSGKYAGRVRNSPLSESLILGVSIGRALAGERPVAFLQFADFLPIAYNQIFSELGSMYWRTDGGWQVPVIVMVTAGGYRPGLGPFHASALEALVAHTPGVDVMMPSSAGDAAGLLNAAFESGRPTIFFYPKNQLNDRAGMTSRDVARHLVPIGRSRTVREGSDITIVAYGNTVPLARQAATVLADHGVEAEILDLRTLMPWDEEAVVASAEKTGKLIVTHEDNHSVGLGAEIVSTIAERSRRHVIARRVTRPDTYVPCNFGNQLDVLPSYKRILETAVDLMGGTIVWKRDDAAEAGVFDVEAIGSSPSDETVTVVEWKVAPGDTVTEGDLLADVEADKAATELTSPVSGTVAELLIQEGDNVPVGTPIARVRTAEDAPAHVKPLTRENPGEPVITGLSGGGTGTRSSVATSPATRVDSRSFADSDVCLVGATAVRKGSRIVENAEIAAMAPDWDGNDIRKRTGIERRPWVVEGEDALTLAVDATKKALDDQGLTPADLGLILFSTGTPTSTTPSMATLLQYHIADGNESVQCPAYDINAACSGYIYGLQIAWDFLSNDPDKVVLLVTSEVLSTRLNMHDAGTAPIFGDAATATILGGNTSPIAGTARASVDRPVTAAKGESGDSLRVPQNVVDPVEMDGPKVYLEAVKAMMQTLGESAAAAGIRPDALDVYIPHQANQRIINAIRQRMKLEHHKMYSNIADNGNTSSSTIPICIDELLGDTPSGRIWGITAFGGGFTYGAALIRTR
ncbi:MAG: thiamine pyrophosphate-dependent enzyme [Alkalispirochaeta sp.]